MNKERRTGERRTGTWNEDEERGTRPGNEARETLRPYPNSVTGTGNEDPPCVALIEPCRAYKRPGLGQ